NIATGQGANASGATSVNIATGFGANASGAGSNNTATGNGANASGATGFNIATGTGANASGSASANVALGLSANANGSGVSNVAIGGSTNATGDATAIGNGASATFASSAAFGNGAVATRANQQMFGTALNTYTAPGITSAASFGAQSGPLQIVTSDAGGNLATNTAAGLGLATTSQISAINGQLASLQSQIGSIREGIAANAAIAFVATPSGPGRTTFAVNGSSYDGVGGVGFAFSHRLAGTTIPIYFSGAYGNGGGRAGRTSGLCLGGRRPSGCRRLKALTLTSIE
ncbi:MAG: hypothetical protein WA728_32255, partial [Xanthobacteraceae bacterium]